MVDEVGGKSREDKEVPALDSVTLRYSEVTIKYSDMLERGLREESSMKSGEGGHHMISWDNRKL